MLANINRGRDREPFTVDDFMPRWDREQAAREARDREATVAARFRAFAERHAKGDP